MVMVGHSDTITALVEHYPNVHMLKADDAPGVGDAGTTEASFSWLATPKPEETYTVDVRSSLSVKFDAHLPVRPSGVRWLLGEIETDTERLIERLFGPGLLGAMETARQQRSQTIAAFVLTESQRLALASLQYESPSTPDGIYASVGQMLVGQGVEPIIEISPTAV